MLTEDTHQPENKSRLHRPFLYFKRSPESYLVVAGAFLLIVSFIGLFLLFLPIIKEEVGFSVNLNTEYVVTNTADVEAKQGSKKIFTPIDTKFGIVIPRLNINAKVIGNVDPYESRSYRAALSQGVAHAMGSSLPDKNGNVFIFAHSSADFLEATRFNSIFYLLYKLNENDEIYLFYNNLKYRYLVKEKFVVDSKRVELINGFGEGLTLMTCWPPGTNFQRLIIVADRVD